MLAVIYDADGRIVAEAEAQFDDARRPAATVTMDRRSPGEDARVLDPPVTGRFAGQMSGLVRYVLVEPEEAPAEEAPAEEAPKRRGRKTQEAGA